MHEVPVLSQIWTALELARMTQIRSTKAVPASAARTITREDGDAAELVRALRRYVTEFLRFLAVLGLVELDTHVRLPLALVRCVADAFVDEHDIEIDYPDEEPSSAGR